MIPPTEKIRKCFKIALGNYLRVLCPWKKRKTKNCERESCVEDQQIVSSDWFIQSSHSEFTSCLLFFHRFLDFISQHKFHPDHYATMHQPNGYFTYHDDDLQIEVCSERRRDSICSELSSSQRTLVGISEELITSRNYKSPHSSKFLPKFSFESESDIQTLSSSISSSLPSTNSNSLENSGFLKPLSHHMESLYLDPHQSLTSTINHNYLYYYYQKELDEIDLWDQSNILPSVFEDDDSDIARKKKISYSTQFIRKKILRGTSNARKILGVS